MKNILISIIVLFVINFTSSSQTQTTQISYTDYVKNEKVAEQIAEIILISIYGDEIKNQKPFITKLQGDSIWVISGVQKEVEVGGVAYIEIRKSDCKILKVTHGK
jgi:hypothetical protein